MAAVRRLLAVVPLAVALAVPAAASAQKCIARPGTAALDQYCETVPTDKGDAATHQSTGKLRSDLPAGEVDRLERRGDEGAAVLALPTGPKPPSRPSGGPSSGSTLTPTPPTAAPAPETDAPPDAPSSNPFSVAFDALGGVGTLGWFVVLTLALLAAVAAVSGARDARRPL